MNPREFLIEFYPNMRIDEMKATEQLLNTYLQVNNFEPLPKEPLSYERIIEIGARVNNITVVGLNGRDRHQEYAWARHMICYQLRKHGMKVSTIGLVIGGRDHSTAIHSIKAHENLSVTYKPYRAIYDRFLYALKNA